ncbi:MAG TPA: transposase [Ktedonobacterales bacterium]
MLPVPESLAALLAAFAIAFTRPTFEHVQVLVTGALLTSGRRTVAAALRAVGLGGERHFTTYHRVLNRAVWSPLRLSHILLHLLVTAFLAPDAPLVLLIDGTLERRWGPKITLKGRYHDAVRSTSGHVVTTEGIHWVCLALLVPSPWGGREWALPVLTVPTRSPALSQKLGKPHRTIPQYAHILVCLVRRWYPTRDLLLVGDSAFAAARLGLTCREHGVRLVSRLVLNAQLYDPVPPQPKGKPGVKPKKGPRQPKLCDRLTDEATVWQTEDLPWYAGHTLTMDLTSGTALWHRDGEAPLPVRWVLLRDPSGKRRPCALFCTDPAATMHQIIAWYVSRCQIEVTFEEVRCHLGVETQRQWSARAIARTTPCLLGLFSLVLLLAYRLAPAGLPTRQAAWYAKGAPTFTDLLALVRRQLWTEVNSPAVRQTAPLAYPSALVLELLIATACYAA